MSLFFRIHTDRTQTDVNLEDQFAGPIGSACWLIGGGPSLSLLPIPEIDASPLPKMTINLAGSQLLRPTFWTSYDPTIRFHRSIYLDPGVMKFVHRRRAMDLVPETTFKVADCPNIYFFERMKERGYTNFLSPVHSGIVDWADSLVQAIDILYRIGFRTIYLAGCDMRVKPSREQIQAARKMGVVYHPQQLLNDFIKACEQQGLSIAQLDQLQPGPHYHFNERKTIRNASRTEQHYFRILQYLRLSRRNMSLVGLNLISVTPHSRLNDHFPYMTASRVIQKINQTVGDPAEETTRGLYSQTKLRHRKPLGPMRDLRPHHWSANLEAPAQQKEHPDLPDEKDFGERLQPYPAKEDLLIEEAGFFPEHNLGHNLPSQIIRRNGRGKNGLERLNKLPDVVPHLNENG